MGISPAYWIAVIRDQISWPPQIPFSLLVRLGFQLLDVQSGCRFILADAVESSSKRPFPGLIFHPHQNLPLYSDHGWPKKDPHSFIFSSHVKLEWCLLEVVNFLTAELRHRSRHHQQYIWPKQQLQELASWIFLYPFSLLAKLYEG